MSRLSRKLDWTTWTKSRLLLFLSVGFSSNSLLVMFSCPFLKVSLYILFNLSKSSVIGLLLFMPSPLKLLLLWIFSRKSVMLFLLSMTLFLLSLCCSSPCFSVTGSLYILEMASFHSSAVFCSKGITHSNLSGMILPGIIFEGSKPLNCRLCSTSWTTQKF